MENANLPAFVRARLADGRLPASGPNGLLAKYGDGTPCCICQSAVGGSEVMYLLSFGIEQEPRNLTMDLPCFLAWETERSKANLAPTLARETPVTFIRPFPKPRLAYTSLAARANADR